MFETSEDMGMLMRFVSEKLEAKSYKAILQRNSTGVLKHVGDVQCSFLRRYT